MQGVDRHARSFKPARQFVGEQDVAELGAPVCPVTAVTSGPWQVLKSKVASRKVGARRDVDDLGRRRVSQEIQQQSGQQEMAQVIQCEGHFNAVNAAAMGKKYGAGIVHQNIQPRNPFLDLSRQPAHVAQRRQVGQQVANCAVVGLLDDARDCRRRFHCVPADYKHSCAQLGQLPRSRVADTITAAGYQTSLPLHASELYSRILA